MEIGDGKAPAGTLTRLIGDIDSGSEVAREELCQLVYDELRIIGRKLRRGKGSLATTDLVHEFMSRILSDGRLGQMKNRRYFYAAAVDQMRRILIDHLRRKRTLKEGGLLKRDDLEPWLDELVDSTAMRSGGDLEALDSALCQLKQDRPRQHEVVQLKFFGGFTNQQVAETLGLSIDTVKRDWTVARARLGACLSESA